MYTDEIWKAGGAMGVCVCVCVWGGGGVSSKGSELTSYEISTSTN